MDSLILYYITCLFSCDVLLDTTNRIFIKERVKRRRWHFCKIVIDKPIKANTDLSALMGYLSSSVLFAFSFYVRWDRLNIQFRRVKDSGRVRPSMSLASRYVPYKGTRKSVPRELQRRLVPSVIRVTPVSR